MFEKFFKKTIAVKFISAKDGKEFARSEVPLRQLPKTFKLETTFYIADEPYLVIKAEPDEASVFAKTKELKLTAVKQEKNPFNTNDILFSTSTITTELPDLEKMDGCDVFRMEEDDWRQIEFISCGQEEKIEAEFQKIREIYEKQSVKSGDQLVGFRDVHVRELIDRPIQEKRISLIGLNGFFNIVEKKGLTFYKCSGKVKNGFYFKTDTGIELYGFSDQENYVSCLGLIDDHRINEEGNIDRINAIKDKYGLVLVNWRRVYSI